MEAIINEIKAAEARAEAAVNAAKEEAKRRTEAAEAEAERLIAEAKDEAKRRRADRLARAEAEASRAYEETLKQGLKKSSLRAQSAGAKIDTAADQIVEAVLHGDR